MTIQAENNSLSRGLKTRHVELMAIGGAIGCGLFLGSAGAIQHAGPSLLFSYALGGVMIFFIMRALGELLLYRPVAGSFTVYADAFIGPFAGFVICWSYWFMWVVTGIAELTAPKKNTVHRLWFDRSCQAVTASRMFGPRHPSRSHI